MQLLALCLLAPSICTTLSRSATVSDVWVVVMMFVCAPLSFAEPRSVESVASGLACLEIRRL
eukprot:10502568-Alexandrium_andersonii.AAC.1